MVSCWHERNIAISCRPSTFRSPAVCIDIITTDPHLRATLESNTAPVFFIPGQKYFKFLNFLWELSIKVFPLGLIIFQAKKLGPVSYDSK